jgi:hypothetical protein
MRVYLQKLTKPTARSVIVKSSGPNKLLTTEFSISSHGRAKAKPVQQQITKNWEKSYGTGWRPNAKSNLVPPSTYAFSGTPRSKFCLFTQYVTSLPGIFRKGLHKIINIYKGGRAFNRTDGYIYSSSCSHKHACGQPCRDY